MLTITPLSNQGSARNGAAVLDYLRATEYYKDGDSLSSSRWLGKGAEALGLSGQVSDEAMLALSKGFAPDGRPLCRNAGDMGTWKPKLDANGQPVLDKHGRPKGRFEGGHRVGYDLTFSADKSFSVLFAAADPNERDRLLAAHRSAVATALSYVEQQVETRRGKAGRDFIGVTGLVISGHTHFGSRDLDPQIHEHCLVYGVAQGMDGQWSTFESKRMFSHTRAAGALYRATLAHELQQLGYGIEQKRDLDAKGRETGAVYFRVAGVSEEVCDSFSKRRAAILEHLKEHGGTAQQACLATRKRKDEPTFKELDELWRQALAQERLRDPSLFADVQSLKGLPSVLEARDDAASLTRLHANESVWNPAALMERLAQDHVGRLSPTEILTEANRFAAQTNIVQLAPEAPQRGRAHGTLSKSHTEPRFVAQWMLDLEQGFAASALRRQADPSVRVPLSAVVAAVRDYEREKGLQLTPEQHQAVRFVASGSGGTACLSGLAGTGKTAVAGAWIRAFQNEGRTVLGVSTGWDAAKKLEAESGIESRSAASLLSALDKGKLVLTSRHVVVFDEAGMAGTQTLARLQAHTDRAGAKLVLQGDGWQLQPVEAGSPFRLAIDAIGDTKLTEIRRQHSDEDKKTAALFYHRQTHKKGHRTLPEAKALGTAIFDRLEARGQIQVEDDTKAATATLIADYLKSSTHARDKLILGGTRAEVAQLNQGMREALQAAGKVGPDLAVFQAEQQGHLGALRLGVGDRVRFGDRNEKLGVVNGTKGVVEKIEAGANGAHNLTVRLESEVPAINGRVVTFDTKQFASLSHGYAMTVHKAQGQGLAEVYQLANPAMTDNHLALVGFTRSKRSFRLYAAAGDVEQLRERIGTERLKTNASEERLKPAAATLKPTPPGLIQSAAQGLKTLRAQAKAKWRALTQPVQQKPRRLGPGLHR